MSDDVREQYQFLQDVNLGNRSTSVQVLTWGAAQTPPWSLLGTTSSGDSSVLFLGQVRAP